MKAIYLEGQTDPVVIAASETILDEILNSPPFCWDRHAYIDEWSEEGAAESKLMSVVDTLIRSPESFNEHPQFMVQDPNAPHRFHAVPSGSIVGVYENILNAMKSNKVGSLLRQLQDENHRLSNKIFARENQPLEQLLSRLAAFLGRTSLVTPKEVQKELSELHTAFQEFEAVSRRVTDNK